MAITFADIAAELIPAANEMLVNNMKQYEFQELYRWQYDLFDIEATSDWENEVVSMTSTRLWPEYDEQKPIPFTEWDAQDKTILEQTEYVDSFLVTRRYLKYGDAVTAVQSIFPRLKARISDFLRRGLLRHSQLAGLVLLDAFAGTFYTALDGQPLASTAHVDPSGGTFSNKMTAKFNAAGLDAMWDMFPETTDKYDVPLGIVPDTLIVSPKNRRVAWELISNTVKPGATNSEGNYWNGVIDKVVVCPWWIEKYQAGSSEYWGMADSRANTLKGYIAEEPHILDEPEMKAMQMNIIGITSGVYGWHDWRGTAWSQGTGT